MQPVGLVGSVLAVGLGERLETCRVVVALGRELAAEVGDVDVRLSGDALRRLDGIRPGPGGETPQANAW